MKIYKIQFLFFLCVLILKLGFIFSVQAQKIDTLLWQYTWKPIDNYLLARLSGDSLDTLLKFSVFYPVKQGFSSILPEPNKVILKQKIVQIINLSHFVNSKPDTQTVFAVATPSSTFLITEKDTVWLQDNGLKYQQKMILSQTENGFLDEKGKKIIIFSPFIQNGVYSQYLTVSQYTGQKMQPFAYFIFLTKLRKIYDRTR
jgi:hypothetical protein